MSRRFRAAHNPSRSPCEPPTIRAAAVMRRSTCNRERGWRNDRAMTGSARKWTRTCQMRSGLSNNQAVDAHDASRSPCEPPTIRAAAVMRRSTCSRERGWRNDRAMTGSARKWTRTCQTRSGLSNNQVASVSESVARRSRNRWGEGNPAGCGYGMGIPYQRAAATSICLPFGGKHATRQRAIGIPYQRTGWAIVSRRRAGTGAK